jgi:glucosamine-6-phosphate deaminase
MKTKVFGSRQEMATTASEDAAVIIKNAIITNGTAHIIAATGASQFEFLDQLMDRTDIKWTRCNFFHLDEYVGLPDSHRASFRRYLRERIIDRVQPGSFELINADAPDPNEECRRVGELISQCVVDVAFVGIGENGHLAFNDPPADFETNEPYLVVNLDRACRQQQVGEGWFDNLDEVPDQAISMSIQQIMKSKNILCVVPDHRKAEAVRSCLEGGISTSHPASILQQHDQTTIYLDSESASLLKNA